MRWQWLADNLDAPFAALPAGVKVEAHGTPPATIGKALQDHTIRVSWKTEVRAPLADIFSGLHFQKVREQCDAIHKNVLRGRLFIALHMLDSGILAPAVQCDAEQLPFPDAHFDCVSVAFGLRNMTRKERALAEMHRVLKPGGRLLVLEFSRVWQPLQPLYDAYSHKVLPLLGKLVANDGDSYRYLAESIRVHPGQEQLKALMEQAGLERVEYFNLSAGVVALHRGYRL